MEAVIAFVFLCVVVLTATMIAGAVLSALHGDYLMMAVCAVIGLASGRWLWNNL